MSDNVTVTPGSGAVIATRDAGGGVEVQRVIPNTWSSGTATDVGPTNPLPVAVTGTVAAGSPVAGENPILVGVSDGTNVQPRTGNVDNIVVIASAAFTTTQVSTDHPNLNHRGGTIILNVTAAGTGSVTLSVQAKDPVSGAYYNLLTGAAVTTNSVNAYTIYPGITVAANVSVSTVIPHTWRVTVTANNANVMTYSVGASMVI